MRTLGPVVLVAFATLACGQSTSSVDRRGEADGSRGGTGQAGSGATAGSGASADAGMGGAASGGQAAGGTSGRGGVSGAAGSVGGGGNSPGVDISGTWAMFSFEDPVSVSLTQEGTRLNGHGCCSGLEPIVIECCGPIMDGEIIDRHARFGFTFEALGSYSYTANVMVSEDGTRMLGRFGDTDVTTAWVRLDEAGLAAGWLVSNDIALGEAVLPREGQSTLVLSAAPDGGEDYLTGTPYSLTLVRYSVAMIRGDLGPFWAGEMTWLDAEQTLVAGPVPVTDPAFPVLVRLRFEATALADVEAEMASGARYLFRAMPAY